MANLLDEALKERYKEESSGRMPILNHKKSIPLLTHFSYIVEKGESEIHVLLLCIQLIRIEYSEWIATAIPIVEKIDRKQE